MPFGSSLTDNKKKKEDEVEVRFQRVPINIRKIAESKSAAPKVALIGGPYTGKTGAMLSSGYLNLEYKDIFADKYPAVFNALKNGFLPEVNRLFIIESENTIENQINSPVGLPWFKEIRNKIDFVALEPAARRDKMNKDRSVEVDIGSIEKIEQLHDQYLQCIEYVEQEYKGDYNSVIGLDSGSRLYKILNDKLEILVQRRTPRGASEKTVNRLQQSSWQWRNAWWDEIFTKLRGHVGYTFVTFMMKEIPKHYREPGDPTHSIKWVNGTAYNFDQIYETYTDPLNKLHIKINSRFGSRYQDRKGLEKPDWSLDIDGRLSIFPAIESMVKVAGEW